MRESFTLYNSLLDRLDRTLVSHSNLHSSTCPIRHLLCLSVSCSGWDYTIQGSSPHKCGQKSCCNASNAVVTTFLLDISAFLSSSYTLEVHPYRWKFLKGPLELLKYLLNQHSSYLSSITFSDGNFPHFSLWSSILGLIWSFSSPRTYPCYQIGPKAQYTNLRLYPHNY